MNSAKRTADQEKTILAGFQLGMPEEDVARVAGVKPNSLHRWLSSRRPVDRDFADRCRSAKASATANLAKKLYRIANDDNHRNQVTALIFLLKCRAPEAFRDRVEVSRPGEKLSPGGGVKLVLETLPPVVADLPAASLAAPPHAEGDPLTP